MSDTKKSLRNLTMNLLALLLSVTALGQTQPTLIPLDKLDQAKQQYVKAEPVTYQGRRALRVTDASKPTDDVERLLILSGTDFQDGVIELEMTGEVMSGAIEQARGFVGLAFHLAPDAAKYECFYLRPTNAHAEDQVRRNHSAQYVAHPDWPWPRLRKSFPKSTKVTLTSCPARGRR